MVGPRREEGIHGLSLQELHERLRRIEDIEEIRRLRHTYHHYINDGHFERFGELFSDAATVKLDYMSPCWRGRDEIARGFAAIPTKASFIKQFVHNHTVDVNGDSAAGYAYFEAKYAMSGKSIRVTGRYDDAYVRIGGRWLFSDVQVQMYFAVPHDSGWDEGLHFMRADGSVDRSGHADKA